MGDWRDELIPPDDPRFEGAEFISREARIQSVVSNSDYLRGTIWLWSPWKERPTISYDPATGEESPEIWDHDHCHFCYDNAFSERYDDDLREGWTTSGPAGAPIAEQSSNYHWVCPGCFDRYRDQLGWSGEPG